MKDVGPKRDMPSLELKHLIWILDWARERCADNIEKAEKDIVRHEHFKAAHPMVCTKFGIKEREQEIRQKVESLTGYRNIYSWLQGAIEQARDASNEEFAQDMADYLRQSRRKK